LTGQEKVVEVLFFAGFFEGENSLYDNEDDDSDAKQIDLGAIISLSFLDFWRHIRHRASVGLEVVDAFVARETEISNFQIQLIVYENVLELEVTVNAAEVVHILNCVKQLLHEEAACVLSHGAHGLAEVEEEATRDVLHHDEDKVGNNTARRLHNLTRVSEVHHSDNSYVIEVLKYRNFILNGQNGVFVASQELLLEDLDGDLGVRRSLLLSEVDFACVAFSQALEDLVLAVEDRVL